MLKVTKTAASTSIASGSNVVFISTLSVTIGVAIAVIHDFLRFQISEHQTGNRRRGQSFISHWASISSLVAGC
jgi:hypothetical protein